MDDTVENILSIYAMIRSLAQHRVGPKSVAGPVRIVQVAYAAASDGLTDLIHFLGILSINLAVINFLPIPPLDGGQMVFLAGREGPRPAAPRLGPDAGDLPRHLPVLCLMIFVTYQDIFGVHQGLDGLRIR